MGGWGSGRRWGRAGSAKDTVDGQCVLDVNWLKRRGYLQLGRRDRVSWSRNGEAAGSIRIEARGREGRTGVVVLHYRSCSGCGEWEDVQQPTPITWTRCHFGGERPWFCCPARGCYRRVGKLYGAGKYFLCRRCHALAYQSQRENAAGRAREKAQKIRQRLGGSASLMEPFPDKPKGMHWQTYHRLLQADLDAEQRYLAGLRAWLERDLR